MEDEEDILDSSVNFMEEPEDYYQPDKEASFEYYDRKTNKGTYTPHSRLNVN